MPSLDLADEPLPIWWTTDFILASPEGTPAEEESLDGSGLMRFAAELGRLKPETCLSPSLWSCETPQEVDRWRVQLLLRGHLEMLGRLLQGRHAERQL